MRPSLEALALATRALSRRPVFSLLNVTLLTLTAAAVATIFAIVNATLSGGIRPPVTKSRRTLS